MPLINPFSCCVMCCGCGRVLMADHSLSKTSLLNPATGLIDFNRFAAAPDDQGIAASFTDAVAADKAAERAGWTVKDNDGPNHRCPSCSASTVPQNIRRLLMGRTEQ